MKLRKYTLYLVTAFIFIFISVIKVNAEEKIVHWKLEGDTTGYYTSVGIREIKLNNIDNIIKIVFNDTSKTNKYIQNYDSSIDLSSDNDGSVMAYLDYDVLYIQFSGKLQFNSNANRFFYGLKYLEEIEGLEYVDFSNITSAYAMFSYNNRLESLDLSNADFSNTVDMSEMFSSDFSLKYLNLNNIKVNKVKNIKDIFNYDSSLLEIKLDNVNFSSLTDMSLMFSDLKSLKNISLLNFNTSNVEKMSYMFNELVKLESINLSSFDTSNVTDMSYMFNDCSNLTSLDLSSFNTEKVTNMSSMFSGINISSLNLSNFNTERVKNMSSMFSNMKFLEELDISGFDTNRVQNMSYMFSNLYRIEELDLSSFDVKRVENFKGMFNNDQMLRSIYVSNDWNTEDNYSYIMFENCTNLYGFNYFNTYDYYDYYDEDMDLYYDEPRYLLENDYTYARIDSYDKEGLFTIKHKLDSDVYKVEHYDKDGNIYTRDLSFDLNNMIINNINPVVNDNLLYIYYEDKLLSILNISDYKHIEKLYIYPIEGNLDLYEYDYVYTFINPPDTDDDKTLTFTTSNSNVVAVNQKGKIYAKNAGKAVITVTTSNGIKETSTITVPKVTIDKLYVTNNKAQVYTGKQLKPKFTIKYNNYTLKTNTDYTISYGKNKNVGSGYVKYKFKGNFTGIGYVNFYIVPPKTKIIKITKPAKKTISIYYKKSKDAWGYQIGYRIKGTTKWYGATSTKLGKKIKNLKSKKTYQVRVRPFVYVDGTKVYGPWSSVKTVKVK